MRNDRAIGPAVCINGAVFGQLVTGVQRYAIEITKRIVGDKGPDSGLSIVVRGRQRPNFPVLPEMVVETPSLPRPIWAQAVLPFFSKGTLLSLGNIGPWLVSNQILCVHDVNVALAPESYNPRFRAYYKLIVPRVARRVRRLTTVSEFSRRSLQETGFSTREDIVVVPNGHEHVYDWDSSKSNLKFSELDRPYVFMIGSRSKHKNTKMIESIAGNLEEIGVRLVITGRVDSNLVSVESAVNTGNITYIPDASDNDLAYLYRNALCLAFPSITEGFGLPVLEAMALDCPVVSSTTGSLPEVSGSAALYADPYRESEWIAQLHKMKKDPVMRNELICRGRDRVKMFSWKQSASVYEQLAQELV